MTSQTIPPRSTPWLTLPSAPQPTGLRATVLALLVWWSAQPAAAGNKTMVNLAGSGRVEASVSWNGQIAAAKNPPPLGVAATYNVVTPAAGVFYNKVPPTGFPASGITEALPTGTPSSVFCKVETRRLTGGYKAIVSSSVVAGATADHPELEARIPIVPANCAAYNVEADTLVVGNSGQLIVTGTGTAGTAVWYRGYYYEHPVDPANPGVGPTRDEVIQNGSLKYEVVLAGPFAYDGCPLTLPFTFTGDPENLYFLSDAVALSIPFAVNCPQDVVFGCLDTPVYPPVQVTGGCGNVTVVYDPPVEALPIGQATAVTVTATDENGNTAVCGFVVYREGLTFHGFYPPIYGTSDLCSAPLRTRKLGGVLPVKFDVECAGARLTTGTPTFTLELWNCASGQAVEILTGQFQQVANEWHFNLDTTGLKRGTYKLIARIQDGTTRSVFVRLQ